MTFAEQQLLGDLCKLDACESYCSTEVKYSGYTKYIFSLGGNDTAVIKR
jgi:hypothetical protein